MHHAHPRSMCRSLPSRGLRTAPTQGDSPTWEQYFLRRRLRLKLSRKNLLAAWSEGSVAIVDIQRDDPVFGYRFIADELEAAGHQASENRVYRLCWENRTWSLTTNRAEEPPARGPDPPSMTTWSAVTSPQLVSTRPAQIYGSVRYPEESHRVRFRRTTRRRLRPAMGTHRLNVTAAFRTVH